MTKSQVNKLGDQLRAAATIDEPLLERLQGFRAAYHAPMLKAQVLVKETFGIDATARLKTVNTIVEKLKRERTRLSTMQDVAGLRIVDGRWRAEQDEIVSALMGLFPNADVDDRRERPSFGYRAVHVVVHADGFPVEIQVRTQLQDLWAQIVERLADKVGRGIRYGDIATETQRRLMDTLEQAADLVHTLEAAHSEARRVIKEGDDLLASPALDTEHRQKTLDLLARARIHEAERLPGISESLRDLLAGMLADADAMGLMQ